MCKEVKASEAGIRSDPVKRSSIKMPKKAKRGALKPGTSEAEVHVCAVAAYCLLSPDCVTRSSLSRRTQPKKKGRVVTLKDVHEKRGTRYVCLAIEDGVPCVCLAKRVTGSKEVPTLCKGHGGGDRCTHVDDKGNKCTRSAVGVTGSKEVPTLCIGHGGGDRCAVCCVNVSCPDYAPFKDHETGVPICWAGARTQWNTEEDEVKHNAIGLYYGFKNKLAYRAEHAVIWYLNKLIPELNEMPHAFDEAVEQKLLGKQKRVDFKKPDAMHVPYDQPSQNALHGEIDERRGHENGDEREETIRVALGAEFCYVIRMPLFIGEENALAVRHTKLDRDAKETYAWYDLNAQGARVVAEHYAPAVLERLEWIRAGLPPSAERPRKVYVLESGVTSVEPAFYRTSPPS